MDKATEDRKQTKKNLQIRNLLPRAMAGPAVMSLIIFTISASMLPAATAWLQLHYMLNNALVWIVSYGWPILMFYTVSTFFVSATRQQGL